MSKYGAVCNEDEFDYEFKIFIIGDIRVGKSNLFSKYAEDVFVP